MSIDAERAVTASSFYPDYWTARDRGKLQRYG
jgi:hypothetical protein